MKQNKKNKMKEVVFKPLNANIVPLGVNEEGQVFSYQDTKNNIKGALMPRTKGDKRMRQWNQVESRLAMKAYNSGRGIYNIKKTIFNHQVSIRAIALHLRNEWGVEGLDKYIK